LFPDVPLLVGGIEARMLEGIPPLGPHDVVVSGRFDRRGVLDTILALRPGTRHIMVVYGASANERRWQEIVEDEFRSYDERIEFIWTTGLSIGEMRAKAAALPPESAILYGNLAVDAAGVPFEADAGLAQLHEVANAPIFGLDETKLGRGIVGGRLVSLTELGREVATTALQLLAGVDPASIPRREVAATHYRFDWRELDRWHISESALPPGSDVRYRPATLWQQHTGVIVSGLLIILFQAILIIIVAVQSRRREKAQHEAHDLNQRILSATEDEKRRLARELHDDFSHRLARLSLDAALLDGSLAPGDGPRIMSGMREQIARLSEDMHALSHQLHPSILEDLGLAEALRTEGDLVARIASLKVIVNVDGVPRHLPPEVSLCAFRIAQEALQNISRHAQATDVNIAVSARNGKLRMTVRDNGVGFEPEQRRKRASLGLASMRERVRLLAGDVKVHSRPGQGTTIETSIPLRAGAS
jgi:signal transduction histidine kinase